MGGGGTGSRPEKWGLDHSKLAMWGTRIHWVVVWQQEDPQPDIERAMADDWNKHTSIAGGYPPFLAGAVLKKVNYPQPPWGCFEELGICASVKASEKVAVKVALGTKSPDCPWADKLTLNYSTTSNLPGGKWKHTILITALLKIIKRQK
jgi:hypothetical protein